MRSSLPFVSVLSGAAALGWQLVWAKLFANSFGHEFSATASVVTAFMAGLAIGNQIAPMFRAMEPGKLYIFCEMGIALWGALTPFLIGSAGSMASRAIGLSDGTARAYVIGFLTPLFVLLPATVLLGITFPALEAWRFRDREKHSVHFIYALNTFGGVAGLLLTVYLLLPNIGLKAACWFLALTNLACVFGAMISKRGKAAALGEIDGSNGLGTIRLRLFFAGFAGLSFEIVAVRTLSQVCENTIYSYTIVLSAVLCAMAVGAWVGKNLRQTALALLVSVTILLSAVSILFLNSIFHRARDIFGDTRAGVAVAEAAVGLMFVGLPCAGMGALFGRLVQEAKDRMPVGKAVAVNTAGAALAPPIVSLLCFPALGIKWTLLLIALIYVTLARLRGARLMFTVLIAIAPFLLLPKGLHILDVPPGGKAVAIKEGVMASVAVVENERGDRILRVNNRLQMGGTAATNAEYRQALLPLLLHRAPRSALFLGVGTGITLGAASNVPRLSLEAAELLPEVLDLVPQFGSANGDVLHRTNAILHAMDARRIVRESTRQYDVIVADVFHPSQDGAGTLYTREHYELIRRRLAPGGLFCQWIPLHQVEERTLHCMVRTYQTVFPQASAWLLHFNVDIPVLGLINATADSRDLAPGVSELLDSPKIAPILRAVSLTDSLRVLGHFVAGPDALRRISAGAPINTDDDQYVTFHAPDYTARRNSKSFETLASLLEETLRTTPEIQPDRELSKYLAARNAYLRGLITQASGDLAGAIKAFLESAKLSGEFTPGYAQVLTLAALRAKDDPGKARELLLKLIEAQPGRPVAKQLLDRLPRQP